MQAISNEKYFVTCISMKKDLFNIKDLFTYFIVAGIGFLIQLLAGSLLQDWFQISYKEALLIGYGLAFLSGFVLTKLFAFNARNSKQTKRQAVKFLIVSVISCLITVYGASFIYDLSMQNMGLIEVRLPYSNKNVNVNKLTAQLISMSMSFMSNYILHKKFTFADTGFYDRLKRLLFH